jgi:hypothetical protein
MLATLVATGQARAQNCTAADFGAVVDQTAQALRELNGTGSQRYQAKVASLKEKHRLSQGEIEARTTGLQDDKIAVFNREIESLVGQMDVLSQTPNAKITCEKLDELKRVRDRLLAVMGQKSGYMLAKVESELEKPGAKPNPPQTASSNAAPQNDAGRIAEASPGPAIAMRPPAVAEWKPQTEPGPLSEPKSSVVASVRPEKSPTAEYLPPPPALPERSPGPGRMARNTTPGERDLPPPPPINDSERPTSLAPPPPGAYTPPPVEAAPNTPPPAEEGYSISDIREAGRGVFGTITAEFAGAINYAFQNFGQPNAYISGVEGGAAFLAGLRYGKGQLYRKGVPETEIYWQGPSAGLDIGAEGSRALFLVYNLDDPYTIYGRFSGIGGSAYVAGGVGLNVLGKGKVVMVPIRSGLGLRFGANLAYVKFTERQTWNPF